MKNNVFGKRVKTLRVDKGYSQQLLAWKLGVSASTYANWEQGRREPPLDKLIELADVLWTTTDYLLGRL